MAGVHAEREVESVADGDQTRVVRPEVFLVLELAEHGARGRLQGIAPVMLK